MNNLILFGIIASGILAIYGGFIYIFRERFYLSLSQLPQDSQERFCENSLSTVRITRIYLITTPIHTIGTPILLHIYTDMNLLWLFVLFGLLWVNALEIYLYRKWLVNALMTEKQTESIEEAAYPHINHDSAVAEK